MNSTQQKCAMRIKVFRLFLAAALLACLLAAGGGPPVRAEEPEVPPGIPRHRVGHRAKVDNLDELLAQGLVSDPLAGNYTLVDWDEIFLAWEGGDSKFNVKLYDVDETLQNVSPQDKNICPDNCYETGGLSGSRQLAVVASDLWGTGRTQIVSAWEMANQQIVLQGVGPRDWDPLKFGWWGWEWTHEYLWGTGEIRLGVGDFNGDGEDSIVLAWRDYNNWIGLKVYDYLDSSGCGPKMSDEKVGPDLDVATGDFNGDGRDEVVMAWSYPYGTFNLKVYEVGTDRKLYARGKYSAAGGPLGDIKVATGDVNGDGKDEVVTAWNSLDISAGISPAVLQLYQVTDNLNTITLKSEDVERNRSVYPPGGWVQRDLGLAMGDFNADGVDEIAFAYDTLDQGASWVVLRVFWVNPEMKLIFKSEKLDEKAGGNGHVALAVGDMDRNARDEMVVAWEGEGNTANVKVYQAAATDLSSISAKGKRSNEKVYGEKHLAVAVGNFDGDSIRVGFPRHWVVNDVEQVLAVINEPPKHYDVLNGTTHNVNRNTSTYASYEKQATERNEMSLTTTRDWGVSVGLEGMLGNDKLSYVKASLTASYGEGFEKTTTRFEEQTFGELAKADSDDLIFRVETDYDAWEYPVYTEASDLVAGHMLVVFPRGVGKVARINGTDPLAYYFFRPSHENGNLFSYSQWVPVDYDVRNLIKQGTRQHLQKGNPYDFWFAWSTGGVDQTKKSHNLELKVSGEAQAGSPTGYIKISASGQYKQGEVSTHKVGFQETTKIRIYFAGLADDIYSFWVEPYIYWSADDGHLVVDYAAAPKSVQAGAPLETWWDDMYNEPDLTFNLPWRYRQPGDPYRLLSKEISCEPASPLEGQTVTITARVRNYSLTGESNVNVRVRFYQGDPDAGGVQIGSDQIIPQLGSVLAVPPQVGPSAIVTQTFNTSGYGNQTLNIYAVVDPDNTIQEVHEDNNKAYAILPVKVPGAPPSRPISLRISPEDIVFDPETPSLGETVCISATIEAMGDAFTFVPVEFWDGDPRQGGQLIGGEVIWMIPAGETATASVIWDTTGKYGAHDIWVGIDYTVGEEDISTDNWAYKTINLPPFRLYLPVLLKGS
jgi:hypothetical protein